MLYSSFMEQEQLLPLSEVEFLATLQPNNLKSRLSRLHKAGWSLSILSRSIGVPKTTIHFWVKNSSFDSTTSHIAIPKAVVPIKKLLPLSKGLRTRSLKPKVPPQLVPRLRELSLQSRRYRARTPKGSSAALANTELTQLAVNLRHQGVPTSDIARAAGVSYRAMARRISKGADKNA